MESLQKKKLKKFLKKKIFKSRKIMWDNTYGIQPIMHALGDTGHPGERDY